MSGFDKIEFGNKKEAAPVKQTRDVKDLNSPVQPMAKRKKRTKYSYKAPLIVLGVIIILGVLISIPAYATYKSGIKTYKEAKLIAAAMKSQNIDVASQEVDKTKKDLAETQKNLHYLIPLKFVPLLSWYYNDADHLMNAGSAGLDSTKIIVESIKPYADVLGFKGQGTFASGSASDRIKTAVMTMGKITPQIDTIAGQLDIVQKEIDKVDPAHYPTLIFGKKPKAELTSVRQITDQSSSFVNNARPLVKVLPTLLGDQEAQKYLILFQNDKELRPTGGFITGYSLFNVDKGNIQPQKNDDIYPLDNSIPNKKPAPAPIVKYLGGVSQFNLRDSNISPDFITSMETFRKMYESSSQSEEVNGIIAIDTTVLVNTIKILDDQVTAGGQTFTTKIVPQCNCPQVIYALENNISRPVNYVKVARKSILGDLLNAILVKALTSKPKVYWGPLFQSVIAGANQKHVMFYLYDNNAQQGIEALNAAGRILPFEGDYLHINEANFSGTKNNIFMQESVDNSYDVANDGTIQKTVTVNLKDPFPASDCSLERGGLCLNSVYKDWIRFYVPKGSELVSNSGSTVKMTSYDELDKTVFEGFFTVRPLGIGKLSVTYKLPMKAPKNKMLPLMIQKQPGTDKYTYNTIVNGKTLNTFPLNTDVTTKVNVK